MEEVPKTLYIDCKSPSLIEDILDANEEPPHRFRDFRYLQRKRHEPSGEQSLTVAFQYFRFGCGGAEQVTCTLMSVFVSLGYRVLLYVDEPPSEDDYPLPEGVIRKQTEGSIADPRKRVSYWLGEVADEQIDLVVYSSWHSPTAAMDCMAIQAGGAAFVYHTHNIIAFTLEVNDTEVINRLERLGYLSDAVIVLSESDRLFWSCYSPHVHVVPNPVDLYLEDSDAIHSADGSEIVWCGRFDPIKQPLKAIDILALVRKSVPNVHLTMVGSGEPSLEEIERYASGLGVADALTLAGYQVDVTPYYRRANAFLLTSVAEGFCLSLAEALHEGLPSVAFELPYLSLVSNNGGLLVAPQDDCETAARLLVDILANPKRQEDLSKAARSAYERVCRIDFARLWQGIVDEAVACIETQSPKSANPVLCSDDTEAFAALIHVSVFETDRMVRRLVSEKNTLEQEVERVRAERDEAQYDREAVHNSLSFRVGRALTAPFRAIRDSVKHDKGKSDKMDVRH